jgi:hypothetical protein
VTLSGGCHCGALAVELTTARAIGEASGASRVASGEAVPSGRPVSIEALPLRACQCSFCRRHGARNTVDRDGRVRIIADAGALVRYRFALRTVDFLVCGRCGVYVACVLDDAFASVNTRALDDAARFTQPEIPFNYSGESAEARRARRLVTWTPASVELRL